MAEKPRLKETDEIFSALGKGTQTKRPLVFSQEILATDQTADGGDSADRTIKSILNLPNAPEKPQRRNSRARLRDSAAGSNLSGGSGDSSPGMGKEDSLRQKSASGQAATPGPESIDDISTEEQQHIATAFGSEPTPWRTAHGRIAEPLTQGEAILPAPQIRRVTPPAAGETRYSPIEPSAYTSSSAPASIEGPVEPPELKTQPAPASSNEGPVEPAGTKQARVPASMEEHRDQANGAETDHKPDIGRLDSASAKAYEDVITYNQSHAPQRTAELNTEQAPASLEEGPVEPSATFRRVNAPASSEGPVEQHPREQVNISAPASNEGPVEPPERAKEWASAPASAEGPVEPPKSPGVRPFVFKRFSDTIKEQKPGPTPKDNSFNADNAAADAADDAKKDNRDKPPPENQALLEQLSNQFDEAFEDAYKGRANSPETGGRAENKSKRSREYYYFEVPHEPPIPPDTLPDDLEADIEAENFVQDFQEKVKLEEEEKTERFKDTLAEKFERERARYLKELGIDPSVPPKMKKEEPESFTPPTRRRMLDIHIDPEMHMAPGEAPPKKQETPPQTFTYSRMGKVRPLEDDSEPGPEPPAWNPSPGKKTAEELLMELGRQSQSIAAVGSRPYPKRAEVIQAEQQTQKPPPSLPAPKKKKEKNKKRKAKKKTKSAASKIITISTIATVLILVGASIPLMKMLAPFVNPMEIDGGAPIPTARRPGDDGTTLYVREDRTFNDGRGHYENMVIQRANLSVRNVSVDGNVLISDTTSSGEVVLEDVSVGGTIQLQNCGVDSLVLRNVEADRLVINNASARVDISLVGPGEIGTIEIRTPAAVRGIHTHGASAPGYVDSILLKALPEFTELAVTIAGLDVRTLASERPSVITLEDDARIEQFISEGAVSLTGSGGILAMSAATSSAAVLVMNLEVPVANLDIGGGAQVIVGAQIDSLVISDDLAVSGSGRISSLIANPLVN